MRERSHKKGEIYQQDVKHWLSRATILAFDAELFGDAYDVTKKACTIGEIVFDFSLTLRRGGVAQHVLYGESKYRNERTGDVNADFKDFLTRVYKSLLTGETEDSDVAIFAFVSNLPPSDWRRYLKNKQEYCKDDLNWPEDHLPDADVLAKLVSVAYVLVLSASLVIRR